MRLVILTTVLSCALGSPILGSEKCTWGPSYWCSHVRHAKECGAMDHCMTTVWKNQVIQHQLSETCTFCQLLVNEVRNQLKNKATQDEVAHYFSRACNILPSTSMQTECRDLVDSYMPEVLQLLQSELSADVICSALGFCTGLGDQVPHAVESTTTTHTTQQTTRSSSTCDDCKRFIGDIQAMISSNETVKEVEELLTQTLCQWLGPLEPLCQQVVEEYTPMILQFLASQVDADITCRVLGFCDGDLEAAFRLRIKLKEIFKQIPKMPVGGTEECDVCKVVVQELQNMDRDEITQEKVKSFIETKLCPKLASLSGFCQQYVEEYAPVVFMLLANELDPNTLCAFIGFCINQSVNKVIEAPLLTLARPVSTTKIQSESVKKDILCPICHLAMVLLDQMLGEKATRDEIKASVDKVCDRLSTADLQKQCEALVKQYEDAIIDFLVHELDPSKVCVYLHLCSSQLENVGDDVNCELCTAVIDAVEKVLKNWTEPGAQAELVKLCDLLGDYRDICINYITTYGSYVLNMLIQQTDSNLLCSLLRVCPSKLKTQVDATMMKPNDVLPVVSIPEVFATIVKPDQVLPIVPVPEDVGDLNCELCTAVIDAVEKVLKGRKEPDVQAELEIICNFLGDYKNNCLSYMTKYGPLVLNMLIQQTDPKYLCSLLSVCPSKLKTQVDATLMKPNDMLPVVSVPEVFATIVKPDQVHPIVPIPEDGNPIRASSLECDACQQMVTLLEEFVKNMSEPDLMTELEKVCTVLPASIRDTCVTAVNTYGPVIIDLMKQGSNAKVICQLVKLCSEGESTLWLSSDPFIKPIQVLPVVSKKASASPECIICEFVMKELQKYIQQNSSEAEIKAALEKVCTYFPATISQECKDFVDQYTDVIISLLQQEIKPDKICAAIGLCSGNSLTVSPAGKASASPECIICEFVMKELQKYIQQNSSEAQIKAALEKVCTYFPATITQECKDFVDQYTDVIISLLQQEIDPDKICAAIGLCSGNPLRASSAGKASASPECIICEFVMKELQKYIQQNSSEAEIKATLEKVCTYFPATISQECKDFMDQYTDVIISLLQQEIDPDKICAAIGLCSGNSLTASPAGKASASPECIICEFVMKELLKYIQQNSSEAEIKAALEKVCTYLPATISQECKDFVDQYTDVIISLLQQEIDPDKICAAIGLCSGNPLRASSAGKASASPECIICEFVMKELQKYIQQNSTEAEIKAALEKVCTYFPATITQECKDFVDQYTDVIISLLQQEIDPDKICAAIGLCSGNSLTVSPAGKVGVSAVGCQICEFAMHELAHVLKQNATKEEIEQALENLCSLLPSTVVTECDDLVKQYGPAIIALLLQELKPNQICTALGLCSGVKLKPSLNVPSFKATQKTQLKAGPTCIICEFVMKTIDQILGANASQQEIENALEKVCSYLPSAISQECSGFIQDYGPTVISLLIQELDPSKVCTALKLCDSKVLAPLTAAVQILPEGKVSLKVEDLECEACTALVTYVDDQLKEDSTVEAAIHLLEKVCALIPSQYTQQCDDIIKEYTPAIAELLALELDPTTVCKAVGLCPASSKKTSNLSDPKGQEANKLYFKPKDHLLGEKECTYGPAYWCASKENAIKCKAVEHCQKHVWRFN